MIELAMKNIYRNDQNDSLKQVKKERNVWFEIVLFFFEHIFVTKNSPFEISDLSIKDNIELHNWKYIIDCKNRCVYLEINGYQSKEIIFINMPDRFVTGLDLSQLKIFDGLQTKINFEIVPNE